MPELEIESGLKQGSIGILDELIKIIYERLLKDIDENLKVGDLLKMIELRHKLAPSSAEQEKFWAMLSRIRRDTLKISPLGANSIEPAPRRGTKSRKSRTN